MLKPCIAVALVVAAAVVKIAVNNIADSVNQLF